MIKAGGVIGIRCDCGAEYAVPPSEVAWSYSARETAKRIEGESLGEISLVCGGCGTELTANLAISEYPMGSYSGSAVWARNCQVMSEPSYTEVTDGERDAFEEALGLGVRARGIISMVSSVAVGFVRQAVQILRLQKSAEC